MVYIFSPGINNTLAWNHNLWLHCKDFGEVDDGACPENSSRKIHLILQTSHCTPPVKHLDTPAQSLSQVCETKKLWTKIYHKSYLWEMMEYLASLKLNIHSLFICAKQWSWSKIDLISTEKDPNFAGQN